MLLQRASITYLEVRLTVQGRKLKLYRDQDKSLLQFLEKPTQLGYVGDLKNKKRHGVGFDANDDGSFYAG